MGLQYERLNLSKGKETGYTEINFISMADAEHESVNINDDLRTGIVKTTESYKTAL
jgi:hypothetical protein